MGIGFFISRVGWTKNKNWCPSWKEHLGTKYVLMSPKEKKKINGTSMLKLEFNSYFGYCKVAIHRIAHRCLVRKKHCLESCENIFGMGFDRNLCPNFLEFPIFDQEGLTFCSSFDAKLASKTKFLGRLLSLHDTKTIIITSSVANLNLSPCFSMNLQCDLALSPETPIIVTLFFSNSSIEAENPFASVVHPGVASFG